MVEIEEVATRENDPTRGRDTTSVKMSAVRIRIEWIATDDTLFSQKKKQA